MDDLERELRDLSPWLETPVAPDVTAGVRARLTAYPSRRRRWRSYAAALAALLLVVALPPGRAALADAVAQLLRFAGVSVATAPGLPAGTPSPLPSQRTVTLDEAQRAARFPIRLPARLGPPERVLVADPDGAGSHRVATLLYRGGALRIDAFDGRLDLAFHKQTSRATDWVQVHGDFAVWVGGPHTLAYVDRAGEVRVETARLAASTLIWQYRGVSYRLEGDITRLEAIEIAASLT
ncbi:hypothetical protein DKT68_27145 [Micromonospora acroterricola]|uniref:DUF4367 domain-containing protein n=1 Tax=Micromonospora acroterricola TaxID=2202421 RepID=A0A317CYN4_9ACTN|nr:hypothetical protein [Micromonospora acroterricola]PWR05395.1 hypothetical protein DKT68_27145 [Micromonospora acroterricola]